MIQASEVLPAESLRDRLIERPRLPRKNAQNAKTKAQLCDPCVLLRLKNSFDGYCLQGASDYIGYSSNLTAVVNVFLPLLRYPQIQPKRTKEADRLFLIVQRLCIRIFFRPAALQAFKTKVVLSSPLPSSAMISTDA
jgi:hypothetical protein